MIIEEVEKVFQAIAEVNAIAGEPLTLYTHTGSMGETTNTLKVEVFDKNGKILFSGLPECVGYESRSNYAYEQPSIKKPTAAIFRWVKEHFYDAHGFRLCCCEHKNWEGSDEEEIKIEALFYTCYACASVEEGSKVVTREGRDQQWQDVTILGELCSYSSTLTYLQDDCDE